MDPAPAPLTGRGGGRFVPLSWRDRQRSQSGVTEEPIFSDPSLRRSLGPPALRGPWYARFRHGIWPRLPRWLRQSALRALSVPDEKINAIAHWTVSDVFNDQERAVLAYADCLTAGDGRTPIEVFDKLKTFWSDEQIFEFTYITTLYAMHAVITRALRMEYDDRDEPIGEVAAPEGFNAADFLSAPRRDG